MALRLVSKRLLSIMMIICALGVYMILPHAAQSETVYEQLSADQLNRNYDDAVLKGGGETKLPEDKAASRAKKSSESVSKSVSKSVIAKEDKQSSKKDKPKTSPFRGLSGDF